MRRAIPLCAIFMLMGCGEAQHVEAAAKDAVIAANAAKDEAMIARDPARLARFYTDDY